MSYDDYFMLYYIAPSPFGLDAKRCQFPFLISKS